jgi:hypothetical protein
MVRSAFRRKGYSEGVSKTASLLAKGSTRVSMERKVHNVQTDEYQTSVKQKDIC